MTGYKACYFKNILSELQTAKTRIRLLLQEQSDLDLHYLSSLSLQVDVLSSSKQHFFIHVRMVPGFIHILAWG